MQTSLRGSMFADLPNPGQPAPPNGAQFDLLGRNASSEWRNTIRV